MDSVVVRLADTIAMFVCGSLPWLFSVLPHEPLSALLCIAIRGV